MKRSGCGLYTLAQQCTTWKLPTNQKALPEPRHTPEKGLIEIKLTAHGQHPIFTITNSGSGISEDDLPHIFERFYRTDESRNGNSYGLGLAIAKSIVDSHGADISVKSEVEKSTCFTITF